MQEQTCCREQTWSVPASVSVQLVLLRVSCYRLFEVVAFPSLDFRRLKLG